jgi:hypothetical protein
MVSPWGRRAASGLALLLLEVCGGHSPVDVPLGRWGGDRVELLVASNRSTVTFCCASGSIEQAIVPDASGHFEALGTYTFDGGPIPVGGNQPVPAHYSGAIDGSTMVLQVATPSTVLGPFTLILGRPGLLQDCICPL